MTPAERRLAGQQGAYTRWAYTADRTAATAPARAGLWAKFERQVDPDGLLAPEERAKRAESLWKAHFAGMARNSIRARRRKSAAPAAPEPPDGDTSS
jgi:hypothetical protein